MHFIGIDGCKAGWFCISFDENQNWEANIFSCISEIFNYYKEIKVALIDMPIGLPHKTKRSCDIEARKLLTRRRSSSVFPIPSRNAIYAKTYLASCQKNVVDLGVKVSKQTWNICNKIKEVDQYISKNIDAVKVLKEAHPELNFTAWNNQKPMLCNKKLKEGEIERLMILQKNLNATNEIVKYSMEEYKRSQLTKDDILDAMILALTALHYPNIASIPENEEYDVKGLKMEIVFYRK
ncbi:DUF429 domain-containing protein [Chondrinema litorale]|uniref:DUF429 domain-containing protein n=1 Tax=Chondrinema litorale TaxID=2994555 RepID=UPI0025428174|nr:DUF429 domain-containing protein [Chondrinema litorale]UZR92776.1 DUF429 domain-containing protein [Chondrinema litorale]